MRRTFFTNLRSADSRGLATALACLMLVVALIGGVHAGAASGGETTAVLCAHTAGGASGGQPATGHDDLCCVAGCLAHAPVLDTPPPSLAGPKLAGGIAIAAIPLLSSTHRDILSDHRPRGPPSFA
jgi:hypothetical protein